MLYTKTFIVVKKSRKFFKARPAAKAIEISNSTSIFFRRGKGRHSKNSVKEFWKIFSNSCTYQSLPESPVTISPRVDIKLHWNEVSDNILLSVKFPHKLEYTTVHAHAEYCILKGNHFYSVIDRVR